jgi:hypothetical protein
MKEAIPGLFNLGEILTSSDAAEALARAQQPLSDLLERHSSGDWGHVSPETCELNERCVRTAGREGQVFSAYPIATGDKVYVITGASGHRWTTTIVQLSWEPIDWNC